MKNANQPTPSIHVKMNGMSSRQLFHEDDTFRRRVELFYGGHSNTMKIIESGERFLTVTPHRNVGRVDLDDKIKDFMKYITHDWEHDQDTIIIYEWDAPKRDCVRCGLCCMFDCDDHDAYETPISMQNWPGKGDHRCHNLRFDEKQGLYGCAMAAERSLVCERYLCYYMLGDDCAEPSFFGNVPYSPDDEGNEITKSVIGSSIFCTALSTQVEWFIAYARRHQLKKKDMARAIALKNALIKNKKLPIEQCSHRDDELPIDHAFANYLIGLLDGIIHSRT